MFQLRRIAAALLLACLLSMLSHTNRAYGPLNHACCVRYTAKPMPFQVIKGFIEQSSREVCRIDAIMGNKKVCASAKDQWVKRILQRFSSKLKTLVANNTSEHMDLKTTNPA